MRADEYDPNCEGCKISQGRKDVTGKTIIELDGGWILNHYGGSEGFLGWLALQPRYHRMEMDELNSREATALCPNIQQIDIALRQYWSIHFQKDPIKRVYVIYFFEGLFDRQKSSPYHLHIHLIPRPLSFDLLLRRRNGNDSTIIAWKIYQLTRREDFPQEYRVQQPYQQNAANLIIYLKSCLWKP